MKVRMLTLAAGPAGTFRRNEIVDVPELLGAQFVAGGCAVALDAAPVRRPLEKLETAEAPEPKERAVAPDPKRAKR